MRRFLNALFAPWLVIILVIYVAVSLVTFALEVSGLCEPDYRRVLLAMVLSYGACVVGECIGEGRRSRLR